MNFLDDTKIVNCEEGVIRNSYIQWWIEEIFFNDWRFEKVDKNYYGYIDGK